MENLEDMQVHTPEDDVSFDTTELMEALTESLKEAQEARDYFPYLWVRGKDGVLMSAVKVTLVKGTHTDGTNNFEIVIDIADR